MAASSSRRNRILALTTEQEINTIKTNLSEIWQRPYDFNDFGAIFEYKNEYSNSMRWVQANDLSQLNTALTLPWQDVSNFLLCDEKICESPIIADEILNNSVDIFHGSDDDQDKTYVPDSSENTDEEIEKSRQDYFQVRQEPLPSARNLINDSAVENCENTTSENTVETIRNLTENKGTRKDGNPRKRKVCEESVTERLAKKVLQQQEKAALKEPCSNTCIKKCSVNFTELERQSIHDKYNALNYESQGLFIKCSIDEKPITRRTKLSEYKRNTTYIYRLKGFDNLKREVCKPFFLSTLGYNPRNDRRIATAMSKPVDEQQTKRGTYKRPEVDRELIKAHIMTYDPAVSHYRREHAPKRLYLPSDITIKMMHDNFISVNPGVKVSPEIYRKVVRQEMNISFAHLGNEECEQCEYYKQHNPLHIQQTDDSCEICNNYSKHHKRYIDARNEYEQDKLKTKDDKDGIYYSVDLQKVIMLPRMEQFKTAIFCPRLIAFNESFVPLGSVKLNTLPYAVLWHEGTSGRSQEDIISTFRAFFSSKRDSKNIVLWMDNCSAQNKNWALLCFLVEIVNSRDIDAESITLKYFEPGHTFMSADSFHHQVEKSLRSKGKVYDFNDFVDSVQMSNNRKNIIKVMEVGDFVLYEDVSSQHKLRKIEPRVYLQSIMAIKVERGLYQLKYKLQHCEDFYPEPLDFLQVKVTKTQQFPALKLKQCARGITQERKSAIINKLLPLMPENRRAFWLNLSPNDAVGNLLEDNN